MIIEIDFNSEEALYLQVRNQIIHGFIQLDRRKGAVISLDMDKLRELQSMREQMKGILAKGICKGICKDEVYELVNEIYQEYGGE